MINRFYKSRHASGFKAFVFFLTFSFFASLVIPPRAHAQAVLKLPPTGTLVSPSTPFVPMMLKGIKVYPDNPFQFDFIVDSGDSAFENEELKLEGQKLIKYFLAALTTPEDDIWVNLSPYEEDRIIPDDFGQTEMGRDLLVQDYLLKQLTASLTYPEHELGRNFWDRIREKAYEHYGETDIPVDTFNKVWIVPDEATVYENGQTAFVLKSSLKVMLEKDYIAFEKNFGSGTQQPSPKEKPAKESSVFASEVMREIILPEIEKEINEGENFATLRQVYHSLILATWFKKKLKESVLGTVYADQNKIAGVEIDDKEAKDKLYERYLEAYRKGVYSYIAEDFDVHDRKSIPRKYFSGGFVGKIDKFRTVDSLDDGGDQAMLAEGTQYRLVTRLNLHRTTERPPKGYQAAAVMGGFLNPEVEGILDAVPEVDTVPMLDFDSAQHRSAIEAILAEDKLSGDSSSKIVAGVQVYLLGGSTQKTLAGGKSTYLDIQKGRIYLANQAKGIENWEAYLPAQEDLDAARQDPVRQMQITQIRLERMKFIRQLQDEITTVVFVLKRWKDFERKMVKTDVLSWGGIGEWMEGHPVETSRLHRIFHREAVLFRENLVAPYARQMDPEKMDLWEFYAEPIDRAFNDFENQYDGDTVLLRKRLLRQETVDPVLSESIVWRHIHQLQTDYRNTINGLLADVGETIFLMRTLDHAYKELMDYLDSLQGQIDEESELLPILQRYQEDLTALHRQNLQWLAVYNDLRWPRSQMQENEEYLSVHQQAEEVWSQWKKNNAEGVPLPAGVAEIMKLRENRDRHQPGSGQWRSLNKNLTQKSRTGLIAALFENKHKLAHRFETVFYVWILETLFRGNLEDPNVELLQKAFGSENPGEIAEERVERWVYEYGPIDEEVEDLLYSQADKILAETFQDLSRKEDRRSLFKRVYSGTILAVALAGLMLWNMTDHKVRGKLDFDLSQDDTPSLIDSQPDGPGSSGPLADENQPSELAEFMRLPEIAFADGQEREQRLPVPSEHEDGSPDRLAALNEQLQQIDSQIEDADQGQKRLRQENTENFLELTENIGEKPSLDLRREEMREGDAAVPETWHSVDIASAEEGTAPQAGVNLLDTLRSRLPRIGPNMKSVLPPGEVAPFSGFDFGETEITQGSGNLAGEWVADVEGGNGYLAVGTYSKVTLQGKLIPQESSWEKVNLSLEETAEAVITDSHGESRFLIGVPPGYMVTNVKTERAVQLYGFFYDVNNQLWYAMFDRVPGKIRIGIRPAEKGELSAMPPLQMVDENGMPLSPSQVDEILQASLPEPLWHFIQEARTLPLPERKQIRDQLFDSELFYYSTNPLLRNDDSLLRSLFSVFSGKCDGLSFVHAVGISYALGLDDVVIQRGYLLEGGAAYADQAHAWLMMDGTLVESTKFAEKVSPLYQKDGVTSEDWETELSYIHSRAGRIRDNLTQILGEIRLRQEKNEIKTRIAREEFNTQQEVPSAALDISESLPLWQELKAHQEYYQQELTNMRERLIGLRTRQLDDKEAMQLIQWVKNVDIEGAADDPYELMLRGHYLLGMLHALDYRSFGGSEDFLMEEIGYLKVRIFRQLSEIAERKRWPLVEPLEPPLVAASPHSSGVSTSKPLVSDHVMTMPIDAETAVLNRRNYVNLLTIIDYLGGSEHTSYIKEESPIAKGFNFPMHLADYIDGLYLFKDFTDEYYFAGSKAGKYTGRYFDEGPAAPIDDIRLYNLPYPQHGDWLAQVSLGGGMLTYIGPVAAREGIEGKYFENYQPMLGESVQVVNGEILIRIWEDEEGLRTTTYVGDAAETLGLKGKKFGLGSSMAYELSTGDIVLMAKTLAGEVFFVGSGAQKAGLENVFFSDTNNIYSPIKIYSQGRWTARVQSSDGWHWVGHFDNPRVAELRFSSRPNSVGDDHAVETPEGDLWFLFEEVPNQRWLIGERIDKKFIADIEVLSPIIFPGKNDDLWLLKVSLPGGETRWIGSPRAEYEIIQKYRFNEALPDNIELLAKTSDGRWIASAAYADGISFIGPLAEEAGEAFVNYQSSAVRNSNLDVDLRDGNFFHRLFDVEMLPDDRWFSIVPIPNAENANIFNPGFVGTWSHVEEINHYLFELLEKGFQVNSFQGPFFSRRPDGTADPDDYVMVIEMKHSGIVSTDIIYGPIAERFGIRDFFFTASLQQTQGGNIIIDFMTSGKAPGSFEHGRVFANPPHNFLSRAVSLYEIDTPEAGGYIPSQRIDLRWQRIDRLMRNAIPEALEDPTSNEWLRVAMREFHDLVVYMRNHPDGRYFNRLHLSMLFRGYGDMILKASSVPELQNLFAMLTEYPLHDLAIDLAVSLQIHEEWESQEIRRLLPDEQWQQAIKTFPLSLRRTYLSVIPELLETYIFTANLRQEHREVADKLNQLLLANLENPYPYNVRAYIQEERNFEENFQKLELPVEPDSLTRDDLRRVFAVLHGNLENIQHPFDAEFSRGVRLTPVYGMLKLLRANDSFWKTGTAYHAEYEKWQELNDHLNSILSDDLAGELGVQEAFQTLLSEVFHDGMALAFLVAMLSYFLSFKADSLRKKDQLLGAGDRGKSGSRIAAAIWERNPWFSGEGFGEEVGARELAEQIMNSPSGMTDEQREELEELRKTLNEAETAVLDAVLAVAFESPQEAVLGARQRLLNLVPFVGFLLGMRQKDFAQRQKMNRELLNLVDSMKENPTVGVFRERLRRILEQYTSEKTGEDILVLQEDGQYLEFEELRGQILERARMDARRVISDARELISKRQNGSPSPGKGVGTEWRSLLEVPEGVGVDMRSINWRATARLHSTGRTGSILVNQRQPDLEVRTGVILNMQTAVRMQDRERWIEELVNSLKILYGQWRVQGISPNRYHLDRLVFIMPDGSWEEDTLRLSEHLSFHSLLKRVLPVIEKRYERSLQLLEHQQDTSLERSFYNEAENERYRARVQGRATGRDGRPALPRQRLAQIRRELAQHNLFLVGSELSTGSDFAAQLPQSRVYGWKDNRALTVQSLSAQAKVQAEGREDSALVAQSPEGGISFRSIDLNMENPLKINRHEPKNLLSLPEEYQIDGVSPLIINVIPLPPAQLHLFLGLSEEKDTYKISQIPEK